MITASTQLKIGLLVIFALVAAAIVAIALGVRAHTPIERFHTYFDESISGLDVGSVVQYRGVRIGSVGAMAIASDHVLVDVALDITRADSAKLALDRRALLLRARLETSGITGVKYVDVEPVAPGAPLPHLDFAPADRYIPARPSLLNALESKAEHLGDTVPKLIEQATNTVDKLSRFLDEVEAQHVVARARVAVDDADAVVREVRGFVRDLRRERVSQRTGDAIGHIDDAAVKLRGLLAKLEGDGELEQAMRDVGGAARAIRELVTEVEREPDMLLKGRAQTGQR